jgi:1,2-diacylglycerol 3-alpha-glucosyltransferase
VRPETTVRLYDLLKPLMPKITSLIWAKQEASVRHSRGIIVPSDGMKEILLRCYPCCPADRIHVLPWGVKDADFERGDASILRADYKIPANAKILLTLSRISPEKGQDQLLEQLAEWAPAYPVWLFICGDAAYMQGRRFLDRLKALADQQKHVHVVFPGHVTGDRKRAFFALADLYVFPSRHESYGLTLLEALAAGLPAVCLDHSGARSVMRPEFGRLVQPGGLRHAVAELLQDDARRAQMSIAARAFAETQRFSNTAAQLATLLHSGV